MEDLKMDEQRKHGYGLTLRTRMVGIQAAQAYLDIEVNWSLADWKTYVSDTIAKNDKKGMDWYVETRKFIKMLKL
jgi:hypothetical protein